MNPPIDSLTTNNNNGGGGGGGGGLHISSLPLTPRTISRSLETNPFPFPFPTTFIQANTTNFKQVVQMLTGSPETARQAYRASLIPDPAKGGFIIPPIKTGQQKKQGFKLYERRNTLKNGLIISPLIPHHPIGIFSPRNKEILSPTILDFPALALSPVTPLNADPFNRSPSSIGSSSISNVSSPSEDEEKAIAEKKFYLHPSPRTNTPPGFHPQLLPLFPVTTDSDK